MYCWKHRLAQAGCRRPWMTCTAADEAAEATLRPRRCNMKWQGMRSAAGPAVSRTCCSSRRNAREVSIRHAVPHPSTGDGQPRRAVLRVARVRHSFMCPGRTAVRRRPTASPLHLAKWCAVSHVHGWPSRTGRTGASCRSGLGWRRLDGGSWTGIRRRLCGLSRTRLLLRRWRSCPQRGFQLWLRGWCAQCILCCGDACLRWTGDTHRFLHEH